jgi:magnesium-transporting ATPase (P-type)
LLAKDADNVDETLKFLEDFAKEGLRTLLLAEKEIDKEVYKKWHSDYKKASAVIEEREAAMDKVAEEIEKEFELVGATAIEDKLQEEVADTISYMKSANIKVWVLTGDKVETAINIGYSCALLKDDMEEFII